MVKTIYSQVPPNATVLQMMQTIHKKKGIPIHEMQLLYNNHQLEEDKSLAWYGITNGTNLTLKTYTRTRDCPCEECKRMERKVTINVAWLQRSIQVECKLGEPVEALKNAIWRLEGIAVAKQKLSFNGRELEDHKLLVSYKFGDEEAGGAEPLVHMFVGSGDPTMFVKLRSLVSFKGRKGARPAPTAT